MAAILDNLKVIGALYFPFIIKAMVISFGSLKE